MQMSFTNSSSKNRATDISMLLTALSLSVFIIWVFINRCELKSLWKVTASCRAVINEYPEMDTIKATLYSELKNKEFALFATILVRF